MTLTERIAYIRGLTDGLSLDGSKDEIKVLNAIIEMLDEVANEFSALSKVVSVMGEQLDDVDEDLSRLEDDFDEAMDCCPCDFSDGECCCNEEYDDDDSFDDEEDDFPESDELDDDDDIGYDDDEFFEVTCPTCGETICISEDVLSEGKIKCPNCSENLEFDFSDIDYEENTGDDEAEDI